MPIDNKKKPRGNNFVFCSGKIVMGPDVQTLGLAVCMITVPLAVFLGLVCPRLIDFTTVAIPIVAAILFITTLSFLFLTSTTEPGIVPRKPSEPEDPNQLVVERPQAFQEVVINGEIVKVKYCSTCNIYRPPRASHCSVCNNCVEKFDHHCPWTGTCIGERNYRYFVGFVTSVTTLCLFVLSLSVTLLVLLTGRSASQSGKASIDAFWDVVADGTPAPPAAIVLTLYCLLMTCSVGGLCCFHYYLIALGQTTHEELNWSYKSKKNPFTGGMCWNLKKVLCSPQIPSKWHSTFYQASEHPADRLEISNELKAPV